MRTVIVICTIAICASIRPEWMQTFPFPMKGGFALATVIAIALDTLDAVLKTRKLED